jgi:hypothetical protein
MSEVVNVPGQGVMRHYMYDTRLTPQENKKLAIALHSHDGPMVPVIVGDVDRGNAYTSHWLFPDGARLDPGPLGMVHEPVGRPRPGYEHVQWDDYVQTVNNRITYWQVRLQQVEREFERHKADLMTNRRMSRVDMEDCYQRLQSLVTDAAHCRLRLKGVRDELYPEPVKHEPSEAEQRRRQQEQAARATLLARAGALVI